MTTATLTHAEIAANLMNAGHEDITMEDACRVCHGTMGFDPDARYEGVRYSFLDGSAILESKDGEWMIEGEFVRWDNV